MNPVVSKLIPGVKGGCVVYWRQPLDRNRVQVPHGIIHVIEERCKGCGFCVEFCPKGVLVFSQHTNANGYHPPQVLDETYCVNCGLCALLCPDFSIYVMDGGMRAPDMISPVRAREEGS
jgi:2-oxoglutarate ferredoxin oxidoreductase subunit delta